MPRFGVTTFPTDYGLSAIDLARAVEKRGLDSIFFNKIWVSNGPFAERFLAMGLRVRFHCRIARF
jgi:hypothetical protein